jgi:hypothetical protein
LEAYEKLDDSTKLKKDFMYVMRSIDGKSFGDPKNKEQILDKMKANPTRPDKRKEYNRVSYLRRKEKQKANNENI